MTVKNPPCCCVFAANGGFCILLELGEKMKSGYIETGIIVGTHGVRGEMRVQPWADSPKDFVKLNRLYLDDKGENELKIKSKRVHGNIVLLGCEGVDSIEAAERLRNHKLYAAREDVLPKGKRYLVADIIGCKVYDFADESKLYGEIIDTTSTGANDVWHMKAENGEQVLIPVIPDIIKQVDVDSGIIKITPMRGLFDED